MSSTKHCKVIQGILLEELGRSNIQLGAELGVCRGLFTAWFAERFQGVHLFGVDAWGDGPGITGRNRSGLSLDELERDARNLLAHVPNVSLIKGLTSQVHGIFADGIFDFIFVDACHSYEAVYDDFSCWHSKVRSGGLMLFHDYGGFGDRHGHFGVKKAIDEIADIHGFEVHVDRASIAWITIR